MQFFKNWGKIGGVIKFLSQTNSILLFGPRITVHNFIKTESKLRPYECLQTDWQTDRMTDRAGDFIICPMLCAIAMGQITKNPAVAWMGRPYRLYRKASVRLPVAKKTISQSDYSPPHAMVMLLYWTLQWAVVIRQLCIQNCGQTAAHKDMVTIDSL